MSAPFELAASVTLLVLDVDGVLTDGRLYYGNGGEESKAFSVADGLGIKLLQKHGVSVAIITGRSSSIVSRRAAELGIEHVVQGRKDKLIALRELASRLEQGLDTIAYMGDDLPDLSAIIAVKLGMTVADGDEYVARHADWRSHRKGGEGAVREACELILRAQGNLDAARASFVSGAGD